jgi:hypothetical protein
VRYFVQWERSALDELADIWVQADSALRRAVTVATQTLDSQLQTDPNGAGESRPGGRRIHFVGPLGVLYRVRDLGNLVQVLHVWLA